MSTILKALRRLEEDRAREQPNLDDELVALSPPRRRWALWLFGGLALAVAGGALGVVGVLTWVSPQTGPGQAVLAVNPAAAVVVPAARPLGAPHSEPQQRSDTSPPLGARVEREEPTVIDVSQLPLGRTVAKESRPVALPQPEEVARSSPPPLVARVERDVPRESNPSPPTSREAETRALAALSPEARASLEQVRRKPSAEASRASSAPTIRRSELPGVVVSKTIWHPVPERRVAVLDFDDRASPIELREGDAYGSLVVSRISPTAVTFDHEGVQFDRRVGERP